MRLLNWVILLGCTLFAYTLQGQALTDTTVAMIAFYELGDEMNYHFKEVEEQTKDGATTTETSSYDMKMTVTDSTAAGYRVRLDYSNWESDVNLEGMEKDIAELATAIPSQYSTDELGVFQGLENWEDMQGIIDTIFTRFIAQKGTELPDSVGVMLKTMMTSMFQSEEQANFWAQDINRYHYFYGANLDRRTPLEAVKYYTNAFVDMQMPGQQIITVVEVDEENWTAHLRMEAGISAEASRVLTFNFLKENAKTLGIDDPEALKIEDIPNISVREQLDCIYDIPSGYVIEGLYQKLVEADDNSNLKTTEYSLKQ